MKSNQTSGNLITLDEQTSEVEEENQPIQPDQRKRGLDDIVLFLNHKLDELTQVNHKLSQLISPSGKKELDGDDFNSDKFLLKTPSTGVLTEPELTYQLSSLLDFLKQLYGFKDCGVFLLNYGNTDTEKIFLSTGSNGDETSQGLEDEVKALWRRGDIASAVTQKRRMILPAEKKGMILIIPFKILDQKDGFWVAHFKSAGSKFGQAISPEKGSSADMLFWIELMVSCIENSYLKKSSLSLQKDKSYHIETEKLFTMAELSRAMVHEINNSLQVILGRTQLLRMSEKKSPKTPSGVNILETIEGNANRICLILKDFSDHLHRHSDETTDAGEVNIQHILKSNLVLLKYILKSNRIKFELNLDDDLPTVYGNPGQLELAFLSLIWEIQDHLSSGGSICLQTSIEEKSLCLNIYSAGKEMHKDGCPEFADLKTNDRFKMVSKILERYHGDLKSEKLSDTEMKLSFRFHIVPERKTNRALYELKL